MRTTFRSLGNTVSNLLRMVAGVTAFGYAERLPTGAVQNHQKRIALDVNLNQPAGRAIPTLRWRPCVKVFTVLPSERNVVRIKGNVNQPGSYEWHPE